MAEGAKLRQKARESEQRENWKRAIDYYELAVEADKKSRREPDLGMYNRIGDLHRRVGNVSKAVMYYDLAADGHITAGFYNNAIALCNKILRNQPNRHSAYLKLGKIGAAKGFLSDARKHFLEYAERMQRAGQLDAAFDALIEFAGISPDPEVRLMIADQLIEHDRKVQAVEQLRLAWRHLLQEGREADAKEVRERILKLAPDRDPEVDPPEESAPAGPDAEGILELPEILPYVEEEPKAVALPEPEPLVPEGGDELGELAAGEEAAVVIEEEVASDADRLISDALQQAASEALGPPAIVEEPAAAEKKEQLPEERLTELERRLMREGRPPGLLVELADLELEMGRKAQATLHLKEALERYEREGRYRDAGRVVDELLRLNVNDARAYQKRIELAMRSGDRNLLVEAYLGLADCLDRTDASNKAQLVYRRVLQFDPQNRRAAAALELIGREATAAGPAAAPVGRGAGYVDLGALVRDELSGPDATRFRVSAADPRSEADVNFAEMLDQFKSKVAEAIDKEDASSHYDLGLAFKDMGLIDEAIAEFQIAARAPAFRLRAIEMLGDCFMAKAEHRIAVKVLGRALQVPGQRDDDLVGIFYALGRAHEELSESDRALKWYERVLGCDASFKDAAQRVSSLRG